MSQIITATFENGLLKPDERLELPAGARVRLTVEPANGVQESSDKTWEEFDAEMERLCEEAPIHSGGVRMTRDELHERR